MGGVVGLLRGGGEPASAVAPVEPVVPTGVGGFAELFVSTYLGAGSGGEDVLRLYMDGPTDLAGVEDGSLRASGAATVAVEDLGPRYWAVTVAAQVFERTDNGELSAGVRHYQVGVAERRDALVATGLPALVAAPERAEVPELTGPSLGPPETGDPVAATVASFLAALLAGRGEVARYAAPGAELVAVDPVPFVEVRLQRVAVGGGGSVRQVRAEVEAIAASGRRERLHYALELTERDRRWEVAAVGGAPALDADPGSALSDRPPLAGRAPSTTAPTPDTPTTATTPSTTGGTP